MENQVVESFIAFKPEKYRTFQGHIYRAGYKK